MGERQVKVSKSDVIGRELCVFLSAFYVTQMSPKRVFEGIKLKSNQNLRKNYIQNFSHMCFDNQICINQKFHPVQNSKIREIQMSQEKRVGCGKPIKRPNSLTS